MPPNPLTIACLRMHYKPDHSKPDGYSGTSLKGHLGNKDTWLIRTLDWVPTLYKYILFSPSNKDTSLIRTIILVPRVSVLERFWPIPGLISCTKMTGRCYLMQKMQSAGWHVHGLKPRRNYHGLISTQSSWIVINRTVCDFFDLMQVVTNQLSKLITLLRCSSHTFWLSFWCDDLDSHRLLLKSTGEWYSSTRSTRWWYFYSQYLVQYPVTDKQGISEHCVGKGV